MGWEGKGRGGDGRSVPAMGGKMMARTPRRMSLVQHIFGVMMVVVLGWMGLYLVRNDTPELERLRDHARVWLMILGGCLEVVEVEYVKYVCVRQGG